MTFFAILGLLLLVVAFFVYVSTIVIGIVIGIGINAFSLANRGKKAPLWWDILAVIFTIMSTVMLYEDIFNDSVDYGPRPFILLIGFGVASLLFIFILSSVGEKKNVDDYPIYTRTNQGIQVKTPSKPKKKVVASTYSGIDEEPVRSSSLLSRVKRNITIDRTVFNKYGINFKCNLVEECDTLQLNFELSNTKLLASKIDRDSELFLKANVYDKHNNLLCIEEVWVEYSQLKNGYAADFFYFSGDNMNRANSMRIYAIDPTDDFDDEDDINDSLVIADKVIEKSVKEVMESYVPFEWSKDLKQGMRKNPETGKEVYDWKVKETWEDYPMPDYDAMHTYCQVAFDDSGKSFYYRTRNPELKVGDMVCVPVGYKYQKKVGKIISMKEYKGSKAPYPLERTKHIIGKVEE